MTESSVEVSIVHVSIVNLDPVFSAVWIATGDTESTEADLNSATFVGELDEVLALEIGRVGLRIVGGLDCTTAPRE